MIFQLIDVPLSVLNGHLLLLLCSCVGNVLVRFTKSLKYSHDGCTDDKTFLNGDN